MTGLTKQLSPTPFALFLGVFAVVAWAALWVLVLFELASGPARRPEQRPPESTFASAAEVSRLG